MATLLSHYLNVTQCTIAHALEKTKYEDADVYWWAHPSTTPHITRRDCYANTAQSWTSARLLMTSAEPLLLLMSRGMDALNPDASAWLRRCVAASHPANLPTSSPRQSMPARACPREGDCAAVGARRKKMDGDYHFSCQFTADVIAMNHADFVLTSTLQEIAGTADTMGQCDPLESRNPGPTLSLLPCLHH